jgi:hypothetical protein
MDANQFFLIVLPLASLIVILVVVVFYLGKTGDEDDYEKEMKKLRQLLIKGKLDKKTFLHIRDNVKIEDIFADQTKRLDKMLKEKSIDADAYVRMKKILEISFNERLEKLSQRYHFDSEGTDQPQRLDSNT